MCGIAGAISGNSEINPEAITWSMLSKLSHRGPDEEGVFTDQNASIGNKRLAIIDLETGQQPVTSENGEFVAILNGEIYNYKTLRSELVAKGHVFRTNSDTECLLQGYAEWGRQLPLHLIGMYSLAIFNIRTRELFISRDRFGEKPLYYWHSGSTFVFSSEIQSILQWPDISRKLDHEALGYFVRLGFVPAPLTLFQGIKQLLPGTSLTFQQNQVRTFEYFRPTYKSDDAIKTIEDASESTQAALEKAVQRQLISDVPIGALLSGGIDSSSIVALMQSHSSKQIHTFTVRFDDAEYDESPIARQVSDHLGTQHHELSVENNGFTEQDLIRILDHVGQPFHDSSTIPTFKISEAVSKHVKVCMGGDGGDELFAGYPIFSWAHSVDRLAQTPRLARHSLFAASSLARSWTPIAAQRKARSLRRALDASFQSPPNRLVEINSLIVKRELGRLIKDRQVSEIAHGNLEYYTELPDEAVEWSLLQRTMYTQIRHNLPDDMLTKTDRMSMATSLEIRAPMLDQDLATLASTIPDKFLRAGGTGKLPVRHAMKSLLPQAVFSHPKTGFSIPLHSFQNAEYRNLCEKHLGKNSSLNQLFNHDQIQQIKNTGLNISQDTNKTTVYRATHQLWSLLQFAVWIERYGVSI